jgi:DNA polymerase-3 subunit gamma/tau
MSYQALARKWRPKTFAELSGQEHVVQALTNALAKGRLHHAYLLTGTRGVGKTTIARILAKSLNCERGVTATPCGVCPACTDIDAGRFVDLLELDAASNTGIDNMRDILDNARYAPTVGRYKVYLIDEVHMLSRAAFNSMLKTLEEPPEHVKFVLATTDPQKVPVTVLSRCLQFNLKLLPPELIGKRLAAILRAEKIGFDEAAVNQIARVAHGSMRDALSVLDQAIAHGGGEVRTDAVRTMLGTVETEHIYRIVDALVASDGPGLLAEARALAERGLSLPAALDELVSLFHRIAVAQTVPQSAAVFDDAERIARYAEAFSPEAVQLAYQICVQGRADMALAPDEAIGFTMTLLRLLAFEPVTQASDKVESASKSQGNNPGAATEGARPIASANRAAGAGLPAIADWPSFVANMKLSGIALQLASQTELKSIAGNEIVLAVAEASRHLTDKAYADKLKLALEGALGRKIRLRFEIVGDASASLAAQEKRARADARARAETAFNDDPFVQDLLARFDAKVKPDSIKPAE